MTRFVDEERMNAGTLKALGYTDRDVMKKFTVYGLIAGVSGTLAGIFSGHLLLPEIIYNAGFNPCCSSAWHCHSLQPYQHQCCRTDS